VRVHVDEPRDPQRLPAGRQTPLAVSIAGSGRPILALHGLGADHSQAQRLLPQTPAIQAIAADLPGHGDTDLEPHEPICFSHFADHVAGMLDRRRRTGQIREPIPVVGVSMGAGIALALAHRRPDLVAHLVLVRPAWLDVTPPAHLAVFPLVGGLLLAHGPVQGARVLRHTDLFRRIESRSPAMAASVLGQFDRPAAALRARVLIEMPYSAPLPSPQALTTLTTPALVIGAPDDPVHPLWLARALAMRLPHARLAVVPRKAIDPTEHDDAVRSEVAAALSVPE
jgi:pimeloyl-ACP methyl ester carboxylesterase